jgi:CelD/BcsL family acetyltransferase involved in cellulose biosynthesis
MDEPRLQILCGISGLEELSPDWARLTRELPDAGYMHDWAWHRSYLESLAPDPEEAFFCSLHDGDQPVAIFPLYRGVQTLGGIPLTTLELPIHEHMHHTDMLVHPEWHERLDLSKLMGSLAEQGVSCDVLSLGPVLEDSATRAVWQAATPLLGFVEPAKRSDALPTARYDDLLESLSKNFRGNLRKARNKLDQLEKDCGVHMVSARTPIELEKALEEFLSIEASGWKGQDGTGTAIANDPKLRCFYRQLVERLGPEKKVEIHLLYAGEVAIAAQFAIVCGRRCYLLKIGYDESRAALAPGNMLLERLLKRYEGHAEIKHVDLVSDAAWHDSWRPETRSAFRHFLFRSTPKGLFAWAALQGKQALRPIHRRVVAQWNELLGAPSPPAVVQGDAS